MYPCSRHGAGAAASWSTFLLVVATTTAAGLHMTRIFVLPAARACLDDYGSIALDL